MGLLSFIVNLSKDLALLYLLSQIVWNNIANKAFKKIKRRMTKALVMQLPDFINVFEVECDAS
jgi:hypothetical protein